MDLINNYIPQDIPGQSRQINKITILKFILTQTGTYNPIYSRPFEFNLYGNQLENITNKIKESSLGQINSSSLAGVAFNAVCPTATPRGLIEIPNSWVEPRIRFVLEVEVFYAIGYPMIFLLQGYTDYFGVSTANKYIDPNMWFFINSITSINRSTEITPYGEQTVDRIIESYQLITNPNWSNELSFHNQPEVYSLRPSDVVSGIQTQYLSQAGSLETWAGSTTHNTLDTRTLVTREPKASLRKNNSPGAYLGDLIDAYSLTSAEFNIGNLDSAADIYSGTRGKLADPTIYQNPILTILGKNKDANTSSFVFNDLKKLDPNVDHIVNYINYSGVQLAELHQTGLTEHWQGSTRETVAATLLSQAVPAIMIELLLTKIRISATNNTFGGKFVIVYSDIKSITTANLSMNAEVFKRRLEIEILRDLTFNGEDTINLEMIVDLFGETYIRIGFSNQPQIDYAIPSFCDHLMTPVKLSGGESFASFVSDAEQVMTQCSQELLSPITNSFKTQLAPNTNIYVPSSGSI